MANSNKKIPQLKGKPKYKDAPRYPMIYDYEGEMKHNQNNGKLHEKGKEIRGCLYLHQNKFRRFLIS